MSKRALYLLGIILTIILGCLLLYFICCKNCKHDQDIIVEENVVEEVEVKPEVTKYAFNVEDNSSGLKFAGEDNFKFYTSNYSLVDSVSGQVNNQLTRLTGYLNNNPNKNVTIRGLYSSNERNSSLFPNLGYARANSVKNYFVSHGVSPKSLDLVGELDDDLIADSDNILYGPVKFDIHLLENRDEDAAKAKAMKAELIKNPLMLYFDTGATSLALKDNQRQKVVQLLQYVENYGGNIQVTGHTDNTGNRASNTALGLKRANFVKDRLVSNGISSSYIKTDSKGPDMPLEDNGTEDGKAKNRRVEVTIN